MIEISKLSYDPLIHDRRRRCPHCTALSRLTHSLLDTRHGNTVRVYQCIGCGKRIWDESPELVARLQ
jgi:DNA-directed RNA polymerase subunit RPC12/RpoP